MYSVDMFYTIKTLLAKGKSQRSIAKELGISRKTVKRIKSQISAGLSGPVIQDKEKKLSAYHEEILSQLTKGKTAVLIHEHLQKHYDLQISYPSVVRYVRSLKHQEVYVPLVCDPGEEAQVDFGYMGRFDKDGRMVKVWAFCMILSFSRYAYYQLVLNQRVATFLACHQQAFEYFGGVPQTVKLDNLKAGVLVPSFYEPIIQHQYAEFLAHYQAAPITARIARGQDKGKVESGIKYVKNNFLKRLETGDYYQAVKLLSEWNEEICNQRLHGTTRKVPFQQFTQVERNALQALPARRYELFEVEQRKVNSMAHIAYRYNYYSVPYEYVGKQLTIKSNGSILKVYDQFKHLATHPLAQGQGQYISCQAHLPPYKQHKTREYYQQEALAIGPDTLTFMEAIEHARPRHWHEMMRGIIRLGKDYDKQVVNLACQRALHFGSLSYQTVKIICQKGLYKQHFQETSLPEGLSGFGHHLREYDIFIQHITSKS